ncbi:hypothetical protein Dsin_004580 [Dipteronia sinensis]|uniref:DUF1985 domain-containing protein n=1 Tax=Dipteronia sinensis TaxID=43782 RepID=A0AAE0AVM8_9ROSI|nr:hypothetical protein Dsin_004580 [Dipteronia sinensis]
MKKKKKKQAKEEEANEREVEELEQTRFEKTREERNSRRNCLEEGRRRRRTLEYRDPAPPFFPCHNSQVKFGVHAMARNRFKQGPFGKYLEIPHPIKVHGMLIYNILKRQIILPNLENEDEIWFGLGQKEARFGREEFCLCNGLNMGILIEGFREKEAVRKESILTRHFADESPTIELLEAIFNRLTEPVSGDAALKMRYLLMVSQFFEIDEAHIAILCWLFSLIEDIDAFERFPWGSYIFDVTLFWLKNAADKHLGRLRGDGQKKEENEEKNKNKKRKKKEEKEEEKKKKKKLKKKTDGEDGEEETDNDNQQNNDVVKYFTFYSCGFLLAFQVIVAKSIHV